ncbi:MAG: hypothetical protein COA74_07250 [Gammaproteobacteria bacterium]|nr:MAG: hypothetical protein COA74_07250 [Gammaproteobacteria bacterium]
MQVFIRVLVILSITLTTIISQANHENKDTIDKRTSPVGQVHIEGMASEANSDAEVALAPANLEPRSGETLYNTYCLACHSTGLANAPKLGDTAAWTRVMEVGMDAVIISVIKGKNVMPPKGNCIDCSEDELRSTILFMSEAK